MEDVIPLRLGIIITQRLMVMVMVMVVDILLIRTLHIPQLTPRMDTQALLLPAAVPIVLAVLLTQIVIQAALPVLDIRGQTPILRMVKIHRHPLLLLLLRQPLPKRIPGEMAPALQERLMVVDPLLRRHRIMLLAVVHTEVQTILVLAILIHHPIEDIPPRRTITLKLLFKWQKK